MSVKPAWAKVDLISTTQIHTQINAEKINPRKQMLPGSIPAEHIQPCFMRSASQPDSKAGDLEEIIGQELCWTELMPPRKTKSTQ